MVNANSTFTRQYASYGVSEIKEIRVTCSVYDIEVMSTGGDEIKLAWDETNVWKLTATKSGNSLRLEGQSKIALKQSYPYSPPEFRRSGFSSGLT